MIDSENLTKPPITLAEGVDYKSLQDAHEVDLTSGTNTEDLLYPKKTAQQDAVRTMNDRLNSSTSMKELGKATDVIGEIVPNIGISEIDQNELNATRTEVIDQLTKTEAVKSGKPEDSTYQEAVATAESFLYQSEKTASQTALIDAVVDRISMGQEADKLESFTSTLGYAATSGSTEQGKRFATEAIQKILEADTAIPEIKIAALESIQEIQPGRFDQRSADILIKVINTEPQAENQEQAEYVTKSRKIAVATAESFLYQPEPSPSQVALLKAVISMIDKNSSMVDYSVLSTFTYSAENGRTINQKRLAATPFRNYFEGKSTNQLIAKMDRGTIAKLAYPV